MPTDSDPNYTENPTLTDVAAGFKKPCSPWTRAPLCLTSGDNKTTVDILALPICLWVINPQFMNHKCVGGSQDALWEGGVFFAGRQMHHTGLEPERRSVFKSGQVGKWKGCVGDAELTFPPRATSFDTWYGAKVKGKDKRMSWREFHNGGSETGGSKKK